MRILLLTGIALSLSACATNSGYSYSPDSIYRPQSRPAPAQVQQGPLEGPDGIFRYSSGEIAIKATCSNWGLGTPRCNEAIRRDAEETTRPAREWIQEKARQTRRSWETR